MAGIATAYICEPNTRMEKGKAWQICDQSAGRLVEKAERALARDGEWNLVRGSPVYVAALTGLLRNECGATVSRRLQDGVGNGPKITVSKATTSHRSTEAARVGKE